MAFSDPRYLLLLAGVALIASLLPRGSARLLLVAAVSLLFAAGLGQTIYVLPFVALTSYLVGLLMGRMPEGGGRTTVFVAALVVSALPLIFCKYWGAALDLFGIAHPGIALPVGISFYTFMALGYLIDVYVGNVEVQRNALKYAVFLSFFPQLTAGPIGRAQAFFSELPALGDFDYGRAVDGLRAIVVGLFMKVVIADSLAPYVAAVYSNPHAVGALDHLLATVYFSFQVYGDFAGYSLIAIGSARLLGIELMTNFRQPYLSQSLPEYWRRWHISLSSWFRDYVFVPLQFRYRRSGAVGLAGALIFTFTLVGAWHGAGPQYALFGFIHGILVAGSTLTFAGRDRIWKWLAVPRLAVFTIRAVLTFSIVTLTFVLFRADSIADAMFIYGSIAKLEFGHRTLPLALPLVAIAILVIGDIVVASGMLIARWPGLLRWSAYHVATLGILGFTIIHVAHQSPYAQQFIYFKF
jgi:D-alanyl-lipoteichoic acid acyltransferase DltB (MBOAT superfamily)